MFGIVIFDLFERTNGDEFVLGIAALLAASTVIWAKGIRPVVEAFRSGRQAWQWIEDELSPNGGESLRDKIDQHTDALADVTATMAEMREKLAEIGEVLGVVPTLAEQIVALEQELRSLKEGTHP